MGIAPCNHYNKKMHKSTQNVNFKAKYAHPKTCSKTLDYQYALNYLFEQI